MSVYIDTEKCVKCGACREVCPGNLLIRAENGTTQIREIRDCWGCTACMKACPVSAISLFLGADIGGRGARMFLKRNPKSGVSDWIVRKADGSEEIISVNSKDANRY